MQTLHIIPASGTPTAPFRRSSSVRPTTALGNQPLATTAQKALALWALNNCALDWRQTDGIRKRIQQPELPLAELLQIQEQLVGNIHEAELDAKCRLRQNIAEQLHERRDLYTEKWFGKQLADSALPSLLEEDTSWRKLERVYLQTNASTDLWMRCRHLVEEAIADADKLRAQLRRDARDPALTMAEERNAICQQALELLAATQRHGDDHAVRQEMRQLYETIQDSADPRQLVITMARAFEALVGNCA